MQRVARDWLVWQLTGSATAVGLATMAQLLPALVLSYAGGVIADRWDRRVALLVSQAAMAPALSAPLFGVVAEHTSPRVCFVIGGAGVALGSHHFPFTPIQTRSASTYPK